MMRLKYINILLLIVACLFLDHLVGYLYARWWVDSTPATWEKISNRDYAFSWEGGSDWKIDMSQADSAQFLLANNLRQGEFFTQGLQSTGSRIKLVESSSSNCTETRPQKPDSFYVRNKNDCFYGTYESIDKSSSHYLIIFSKEKPTGLARILGWSERGRHLIKDLTSGAIIREVRWIDFAGGWASRNLYFDPIYGGNAPAYFFSNKRNLDF